MTCPIVEQAELTVSTALLLVSALRKLRRMSRRCTKCAQRATCPEVDYYRTAIDTAIKEVEAEWEKFA